MNIILKEAYENGAYSPIQTWDSLPIPETHAVVPDTLDTAIFYEYNGFVFLTIKKIDGVDTVTKMEANVLGWEDWKASLPEPEPEPIPEPTADEILNAMLGVTE